jgi:monoamine oxidase
MQRGIDVTVYEGSTRVGGRCWTNRTSFDGGQIAEHGGELIDQSHTTIRQLAQELGLPLDNVLAAEPNGTEPFFRFDGGGYPLTEVVRDLKAVWQPLKRDYQGAGFPTLYTSSTPEGRALDAMSIADWISTRVPGGLDSRLGQLLAVAYTIEYGGEVQEQSSLNLIYLLGLIGQGQLRLFGPSNEKYKVRGGNDRIVSGLASALGQRVVTGKSLAAIRASGSGWTLDFEDRTSVAADRVVLAIPFSVMRDRVDSSGAGFPLPKRQAIAELGMGMNAKLACGAGVPGAHGAVERQGDVRRLAAEPVDARLLLVLQGRSVPALCGSGAGAGGDVSFRGRAHVDRRPGLPGRGGREWRTGGARVARGDRGRTALGAP